MFHQNWSGWWCKNNLEKYEFVNGKDDIPHMEWKIKFMFETTYPSEKMSSSLGSIIPNWMESHKIPWFQSPPTRWDGLQSYKNGVIDNHYMTIISQSQWYMMFIGGTNQWLIGSYKNSHDRKWRYGASRNGALLCCLGMGSHPKKVTLGLQSFMA